MLSESHPLIRLCLRYLALPYCYFRLINWDECKASKLQVIKDLLYISFVLRYYPYNYSLCRLWEKDRKVWGYYYGSIYDPFQRSRLRRELHRKEYEILFEDKYVCYQLCMGNGLPQPELLAYVTPVDQYRERINAILSNDVDKKIIIKPIKGKGGGGIAVAFMENGEILVVEHDVIKKLNEYSLPGESIVQEYVEQHVALSGISSSVNTVRIVTLLTKSDHVLIIGALMRFGVGDKYVDNTSIGGVAVGINLERGALQKTGYDNKSRVYESHPLTNVLFDGFVIPYWKEVMDLARNIQKMFFYNKMLGLDIAITQNGPVLIEINAEHDNVGLEQKCGPILANEMVYAEFVNYDLLFNNVQKNLYKNKI